MDRRKMMINIIVLVFVVDVYVSSAFQIQFPKKNFNLKASTSDIPSPNRDKILTNFATSNNKTLQDPYLKIEDRPYLIGTKPNSAIQLASSNFKKEVFGILSDLGIRSNKLTFKQSNFPTIFQFKLANEIVKQAEKTREENGNRVDAHPIARFLYDVGCLFLDKCFDGRPIERFWFLETVARIPYFSYVSMLHLYETLGIDYSIYWAYIHESY